MKVLPQAEEWHLHHPTVARPENGQEVQSAWHGAGERQQAATEASLMAGVCPSQDRGSLMATGEKALGNSEKHPRPHGHTDPRAV